jgi:hypothetical protein
MENKIPSVSLNSSICTLVHAFCTVLILGVFSFFVAIFGFLNILGLTSTFPLES